jgi:hypothetical protein
MQLEKNASMPTPGSTGCKAGEFSLQYWLRAWLQMAAEKCLLKHETWPRTLNFECIKFYPML